MLMPGRSLMTFTALWGGKCAACGHGIRVGDECTFADDTLVHADCADSIPARGQSETVCPRCFLTSCDCEAP